MMRRGKATLSWVSSGKGNRPAVCLFFGIFATFSTDLCQVQRGVAFRALFVGIVQGELGWCFGCEAAA